MLNFKLLTTLTVSGMAFVGSVGNHLVASTIQDKAIKTSGISNFYKNVTSYQEVKDRPLNKEKGPEDYVISAIESDLNKEIKRLRIKSLKDVLIEEEITVKSSALSKSALPAKLIIESNQENFEINNTDDFIVSKIEHVAYQIAKIEVPDFKYEAIVDNQDEIITENIGKEDDTDLMVFDYNKNKNDMDKKLYERPISETVKKVIKREMASIPNSFVENISKNSKHYNDTTVKTIQAKNQALNNQEPEKAQIESDDQIVFDYSTVKNNAVKKETSNFAGTDTTKNIKIEIKANEINIVKKEISSVLNFDFEPDYDRNERFNSKNTGVLELENFVAHENSTLSGRFNSKGNMTIRTEVLMNTHELIIPFITEESFETLLETNKVETENAILVTIHDNIKDAEIIGEYSKKIKLDENFNTVEENEKYIMFLGLKNGNNILKYSGDEYSAQKIVFINEGEIYFDDSIVIDGNRKTIELFTRSLLSSNQKELNLSNINVKLLDTDKHSKKVGLNGYEVLSNGEILGGRTYLEIKSDNDIFVGLNNEGKVEVPTIDFTSKIIQEFKQTDLKNKCLVQINLNQDVEEFKARGFNDKGEMYNELMFLDKDGKLGPEVTETTEKAFILGEGEGQIAINVKNINGSEENLKTLCANDTFLVEELN